MNKRMEWEDKLYGRGNCDIPTSPKLLHSGGVMVIRSEVRAELEFDEAASAAKFMHPNWGADFNWLNFHSPKPLLEDQGTFKGQQLQIISSSRILVFVMKNYYHFIDITIKSVHACRNFGLFPGELGG